MVSNPALACRKTETELAREKNSHSTLGRRGKTRWVEKGLSAVMVITQKKSWVLFQLVSPTPVVHQGQSQSRPVLE